MNKGKNAKCKTHIDTIAYVTDCVPNVVKNTAKYDGQ